jgi:hypothetical protein
MIPVDHTKMRLGCVPSSPKALAHELKLAHYVNATVMGEFVPPEFDLFIGVPDSVDLNNKLGDCVVATMAKQVRSWTQNATGTAVIITDSDILDVYKRGAGYVEGDPNTDNGWDLISQLNWWRKYGIAGHKIEAYASVNPRHPFMMSIATYLFGGLDIALALPVSAQNQEVWDAQGGADGEPASWGNHCVTLQAKIGERPTVRTWGYAQPCTWAFIFKHCTEAHAAISKEALTALGTTPAGLSLDRMMADLKLVTA